MEAQCWYGECHASDDWSDADPTAYMTTDGSSDTGTWDNSSDWDNPSWDESMDGGEEYNYWNSYDDWYADNYNVCNEEEESAVRVTEEPVSAESSSVVTVGSRRRCAGLVEVEEGARFAFLTCEPNALVGAVHPKAMPVMLAGDGLGQWLRAEWEEAERLVAPFPDNAMAELPPVSPTDASEAQPGLFG